MRKKRMIRISTISRWGIIMALLTAILLIVVIVQTDHGFEEIQSATSQYVKCVNAASSMENASVYLMEQVQLFVISGNKRNLKLYFQEVNISKRREKAIAEFRNWFSGTATMELLNQAYESSLLLMEKEYHAMRLAAEAFHLNMEDLPEVINGYSLTHEEAAMTDLEKREYALDLISDQEYQTKRSVIADSVNECMDNIRTEISRRERRSATIFRDAYRKLKVSVAILIFLIVGVSIALRQIIVLPLRKYNRNVKSGDELPLEGAFELQNLARTYNSVYEENLENQRLLRHEAEHDALTKLFNRGVFTRLLSVYTEEKLEYAVLLIDVDHFKDVNDIYGHIAGDKVLCRIAEVLQKQFRSSDYICRVGGDEFAIIMGNVSVDYKEIISKKLNAVRKELAESQEEMLQCSISIGIAFSGCGNNGEDIYKDADLALYSVKENGRDGYAFYE